MFNCSAQSLVLLLTMFASGLSAAISPHVSPPSSYAPLPEAITSFGAVAHDGWLYVYGGHRGERHAYSSNDVSGTCRRLSLLDGFTWETLPADLATQSPGLVVDRDSLYRLGGMAARNPKGDKQDLFSQASASHLAVNSDRWEPIADLPEPRSSHDAAIVSHRIYLAGGWHLRGAGREPLWHDTALVLDLSEPKARWKSFPQPFKRRGLALASLGPRLFCLGGMSEGDSPSLAVDILDTKTGAWSRGPDLPPGRLKGFGASACVVNDRLYISGMSGTVWRLSDDGRRWEEAAQLRTPRFFHRLMPGGDGQLLAVGGEGSSGKLREIEVISIVPQSAGYWPGFRGPHRDGITRESLDVTNWPSAGAPVLWRSAVGQGISSFAISRGRAYTLGNSNGTDTLWCLNAINGTAVWRHDYACVSTNHPMSVVPSGPASTPAVADGRLYGLSREGDFHCVSANDGRLIWKRHLLADLGGKRPIYGYANSPLVAGGLVFLDVGGTNGSTVALSAETGALRWRAGRGEAGYSSPRLTLVAGQPTLAMFQGEAFTLMNPFNGQVISRYPTTTRDFCNTITPVVAGATAFISNTGTDGTQRLDFTGATPHVVWQNKNFGLLFNSPVLWQGHLYGFNDARRNESELVCLEAATGKIRWSSNEIEKGTSSIADGHMVVLTRRGELVVASLGDSGPSVVIRIQCLGGKSWAEPVVAGGRVYCRNNDGTAVCLGLR